MEAEIIHAVGVRGDFTSSPRRRTSLLGHANRGSGAWITACSRPARYRRPGSVPPTLSVRN